jgi:transcriptional regulator with XRE-family HTH domain
VSRGEHVGGSKLTAEQVIEIRNAYLATEISQEELASRYGVTRRAIGDVVRGKRWAHLPFDREACLAKCRFQQSKVMQRHRAKLNPEKVEQIRRLLEEKHLSRQQIAERFGVGKETIHAIAQRRIWVTLYPSGAV